MVNGTGAAECLATYPTLFSYILRYDDGAAPNPFWGTCTLVICKPKIRRAAKVGDWIVGLGSKSNPVHTDHSRKIVYAMKVTSKMSMGEYDKYVNEHLPQKRPDVNSADWRRRLGDSIYDFSRKGIPQRPGVHRRANRKTDMRGKFALLSDEFVYYGQAAVPLPRELNGILHQGQGHRSRKNEEHIDAFLKWWAETAPGPGEDPVKGEPQWKVDPRRTAGCATGRRKEAEQDEKSSRGLLAGRQAAHGGNGSQGKGSEAETISH